jgi:hypothetical protein
MVIKFFGNTFTVDLVIKSQIAKASTPVTGQNKVT